jgi:hypothetical protein
MARVDPARRRGRRRASTRRERGRRVLDKPASRRCGRAARPGRLCSRQAARAHVGRVGSGIFSANYAARVPCVPNFRATRRRRPSNGRQPADANKSRADAAARRRGTGRPARRRAQPRWLRSRSRGATVGAASLEGADGAAGALRSRYLLAQAGRRCLRRAAAAPGARWRPSLSAAGIGGQLHARPGTVLAQRGRLTRPRRPSSRPARAALVDEDLA